MADIQLLLPPPHRNAIPIFHPLTKSGWPYAVVDPKKIVAVVENEEADHVTSFSSPGDTSEKIASHVVTLLDQLRQGRIPSQFLPLQAGVGNTANAVMLALGQHPDIPFFDVFRGFSGCPGHPHGRRTVAGRQRHELDSYRLFSSAGT
jgi:acetyl-CoA hydrolase